MTSIGPHLYIYPRISHREEKSKKQAAKESETYGQKEYNTLTRRLKVVLQDVRNATFECYITSLSSDDHSVWKAIKLLKRPIVHIPPLLQEDGIWGVTYKGEAAAFAAYLSNVFITPQTNNNCNTDDTVQISLDSACPVSLPIPQISPTEVKEEIFSAATIKHLDLI